jgi:hypothetical protein
MNPALYGTGKGLSKRKRESKDMSDPRVEALYYTLKRSSSVDYADAGPLYHETPGFTVRVEDGRAEVKMKSHHAAVETARAEVEPFLVAWEIKDALEFAPGHFGFVYNRANIIDGTVPLRLVTVDHPLLIEINADHISRSKYPDPPLANVASDSTVEQMFREYCLYRGNGTKLGHAANFCLTVLQTTANGLKGAAKRYAISETVLRKIGDLAANKGGSEARKARGAKADFTAAERGWLERAIKCLIWRAAEVAGNPSAPLPQITMGDLPPLS